MIKQVVSDEHVELFGGYFGSMPGMKILAALNEIFVDRTLFDVDSSRITTFRLGQAELVKFLNNTVKAVKEKTE